MSINKKAIIDSYWVLPGRLLAGEYPCSVNEEIARQKLRWLLDNGISMCLDLTKTGESGLKPYDNLLSQEASASGREVLHRRMPIQDMSTPTPAQMMSILDTVDSSLNDGQIIYLHCYGGVGRTGTVVGCFLVRHGLEGVAALKQISRLRQATLDGWKTSPETDDQKALVLNWKELDVRIRK